MIVIGQEVAAWICLKTGGCVTPNTQGIGNEIDGILTAGVSFEGWNGVNAYVHQRIDKHPPRAFWWTVADFGFNHLGCKRLTGTVAASNHQARRLDEHIGFEHEATLKGAAEDGGDLLVYVLWRDKCRFLNWRK